MTKKKPITKKAGTTIEFEKMGPEGIFAAWEAAARKALDPALHYEDFIFDPDGPIVQSYITAIKRHMGDTGERFSEEAFENSTQVAADIGRVCSIIAAHRTDKKVTRAIFRHAAKLAEVHPSCPKVTGGGGRWCEVP